MILSDVVSIVEKAACSLSIVVEDIFCAFVTIETSLA